MIKRIVLVFVGLLALSCLALEVAAKRWKNETQNSLPAGQPND